MAAGQAEEEVGGGGVEPGEVVGVGPACLAEVVAGPVQVAGGVEGAGEELVGSGAAEILREAAARHALDRGVATGA
ncbi:hypothetical protein GCM10022221_44900 [Actinocorallia aurea]